jgi:small subunit ribosomal protein S7
MSRKRAAQKRIIPNDSKYNDPVIAKFMNILMYDGKKYIAERVVYQALDFISKKTGEEPLSYFHKALNNIKPQVEVKSRRVGGATYQVPVEVSSERQKALAIRWIITYSRARKSEKTLYEKLASELMDAFNNRGASFKKKDDTHKMAEANRAFAHYRW